MFSIKSLSAIFFTTAMVTMPLHAADQKQLPPFLPPPTNVEYHPEDFLPLAAIQTETASGKKLFMKDWCQTRSLDGNWRISGLKNSAADFNHDLDRTIDYLQPGFDDAQWETIQVPLDWYQKYKPFRDTQKPFVTGCYRRTIELSDADLKDRAVMLHFGVIGSEGILFINGQRVGSHLGNFTPWNIDITDYVKPGKNILALQVFADFGQQYGTGRPDRICQGAQFSIGFIKGGLWQSVSLELRARPTIRQILITPLYAEKKIRVDYIIDNPDKPFNCTLGLAVSSSLKKDQDGKATAQDFPAIELKTGTNAGTLFLNLPLAKSWSPNSPYLYYATLYLQKNGEVVSADAQRFGFREFKTVGEHFLLNSQRIHLFGENFHAVYADGTGLNRQQERDRFVKILSQFKAQGYNILRTAHQPTSPLLHEVADELGMMIYNEWAWSFVTKIDKKLFPINTEREMHEWVIRDYNRPSVVMWSCGNEVPSHEPFIKELLNQHVKLVRQWDLSGRPVSVFSGSGEWVGFGRGKMETDVVDLHCYWGLTTAHWTYWNDKVNEYYKVSAEDYGKPGDARLKIPYIVWEAVGYSWGNHHDRDFKLNDIDAYARYVKTPYTWAMSKGIGFSGTIGLAAALDPERSNPYAQAVYGKRLIELIRQDDRIQGVAPWFINPTLAPARIWNQPVFCGLRWGKQALPPRSFFGGIPSVLELYWINSSNTNWKNAVLNLEFVDAAGKNHPLSKTAIATVIPWQLEARKMTLTLPNVPQGWGQLRLVLNANGNEISRNYYDVFVAPGAVMTTKIKNNFKTGIWNSANSAPFKAIIKSLGLSVATVTSVAELTGIDALIIPPETEFDRKANSAIMEYINRGGRVLLMEQGPGPMPAIDNYTGIKATTPFVDLAIPAHPIFRNLIQENFDTWNNPDYGKVINTAIAPFTVNALAVRGPIYGQTLIGNAVMEGTYGKGRLICSQLNAVNMWGIDASATVYLHNLLAYFLDGKNDYAARQLDILENRNYPVASERIVKIDLRSYANRGFKDEKDGDRLGGWIDQGNKDFRHMPLGAQTLLNVPFDIIDPAKNQDKSALILGGGGRPYFPSEIKGIAVNGKFARLYFLQTSAWTRTGMLGYYKFNYADGTSSTLDLVGNTNIGDWCDCQDLPQARLGVVYDNKEVAVADGFNLAGRIGLWITEWRNPCPEKEIKTVDFVSNGKSVLVLIAMSGETINPERLVIFQAGRKSKFSAGAWRGGESAVIKDLQDPQYSAINLTMPARKDKGISIATFWFDTALLNRGKFKYLSLVWRCSESKGAVDLVMPNKEWKNTLHKTLFLRDGGNTWTENRIPLSEMGLGNNFKLEDLRGEFYFYNGVRHSLELPVTIDLHEIALE